MANCTNPYAFGGVAPPRMMPRGPIHEGQINSVVPGRTDHVPLTVGGGSYVLPADHLSAIGQGNSAAGAHIMNRMLGMPHMGMRPPRLATGGAVPIEAAGGEFVIPPQKVREIGSGDIDRGHQILDHWVMSTRKKHIKTLRGLKPPKKD